MHTAIAAEGGPQQFRVCCGCGRQVNISASAPTIAANLTLGGAVHSDMHVGMQLCQHRWTMRSVLDCWGSCASGCARNYASTSMRRQTMRPTSWWHTAPSHAPSPPAAAEKGASFMRINIRPRGMKHAYTWLGGRPTHPAPAVISRGRGKAEPAACGRCFANATDGSFSLRIDCLRFGESVPCADSVQFGSRKISRNIWPVSPNPQSRTYKRRSVNCNHNPLDLLPSTSYLPPL